MSGLIRPSETEFAAVASFITIARNVEHAPKSAADVIKSLFTQTSHRFERQQYFFYDSASAGILEDNIYGRHLDFGDNACNSDKVQILEIPFTKTRENIMSLMKRMHNSKGDFISSVVVVSHPRFAQVHEDKLPTIFGDVVEGIDGIPEEVIREFKPTVPSVPRCL